MMKFFILAILATAAHSFSVPPPQLTGTPLSDKKFSSLPYLSTDGLHIFSTSLDYTDPTTADALHIRYFVNSTYMLDSTSPIMITMGGEGTASGVRMTQDVIDNHAIAVQVEHRFYGESVPGMKYGGGSNKNLKAGLSVEFNAIDTGRILEQVQQMFGSKDRPVINYGGSYSGATATWFRMAYPDLTDGTVSSSGVVNAIYDFVEFDEAVAEALNVPEPMCAVRVRELQMLIDGYFEKGDGDTIKEVFNATNLINTKHGDTDFMYMVADGYSMMVQYGAKLDLCEGLKGVDDQSDGIRKIQNLAEILTKHYGSEFGQDCYYDSECLKVENNKDEVPGTMGSQNSRSWRWQKCSQLAYLQSRPKDETVALRSKLLTLDALEEQCVYVFGEIPARDADGNSQINDKFGSSHPEASKLSVSNVFSISYSDDPWKEASVSESLGSSMPYCYTECDGCGHCGAGVEGDNLMVCMAPQKRFVRQVLAQARFDGEYSDPNHPGSARQISVKVTAEDDDVTVTGFDIEDGVDVQWGPLHADIDDTKIVVDFSPKGGPADLTGRWDADVGGIVWADGNVWPKQKD